jgi:hypothetical protein
VLGPIGLGVGSLVNLGDRLCAKQVGHAAVVNGATLKVILHLKVDATFAVMNKLVTSQGCEKTVGMFHAALEFGGDMMTKGSTHIIHTSTMFEFLLGILLIDFGDMGDSMFSWGNTCGFGFVRIFFGGIHVGLGLSEYFLDEISCICHGLL